MKISNGTLKILLTSLDLQSLFPNENKTLKNEHEFLNPYLFYSWNMQSIIFEPRQLVWIWNWSVFDFVCLFPFQTKICSKITQRLEFKQEITITKNPTNFKGCERDESL